MEESLKSSLATNLFYTVIPTAALAFAIATVVPSPPFSIPLFFTLVLTVILLRLSAWVSYRNCVKSQGYYEEITKTEDDEENQNSDDDMMSSLKFYNKLQTLFSQDRAILKIFYPACFAYIIILIIRLLAVDNFGGDPSLLDFGPKISKNGPSGDTNIAFETLTGATVGHFVQGFVAAILSYPAVSGIIAKVAAKLKWKITSNNNVGDCSERTLLIKPCLFTLCLIELLQSCMTYYVLYSMVKRLRYTSFSQTSHVQNTTEWSLGMISGISVGSLASALIQRQLIVTAESNESRRGVVAALTLSPNTESNIPNKKCFVFGKSCEYEDITPNRCILRMVRLVSFANLVIFALTVFLTSLFLGLSWNYNNEDPRNAAMVAIFMAVFVVVFATFFILIG